MFAVKFIAYKSVFSWLYYDDLLFCAYFADIILEIVVVKYVLSVSKQACKELLLLLRTIQFY